MHAASFILYDDKYWKINQGIVWKSWLPNNATTLKSPSERHAEIPAAKPKTDLIDGKSIVKNLFSPLIPSNEQSLSCFFLR